MSLHYGEPQVAVGIVFAVLAVAIIAIFVVVARSAREDVAYERVQRTGYRLRRYWLTVLASVGVAVIVLTFFYLPYASGSAANRTVVKVTGGQFFWSLSPGRVQAGTPVRFDVTSVDVNHGFGVYDPHGHLIGSVQAMPGYHNKLDLTLTIPGSYRIRCLEFCGLNHAVMQGTFTVLPAAGGAAG
jgi:cytochrome c oxidase subunit 2